LRAPKCLNLSSLHHTTAARNRKVAHNAYLSQDNKLLYALHCFKQYA